MKKQYEKPELERFGTVSQLSAGGSLGAPELDGVPPNNDPEPNLQRP